VTIDTALQLSLYQEQYLGGRATNAFLIVLILVNGKQLVLKQVINVLLIGYCY